MRVSDSCVRARIDRATKEQTARSLEAMGLSVSDAIRLLMHRVADARRLPFEIREPNTESRQAMAELESRQGRQHDSVDAL